MFSVFFRLFFFFFRYFDFCDFWILRFLGLFSKFWIIRFFDYRQIRVPRDFFSKTISDADLDFSGNNFVMISVRHVHGRAGGGQRCSISFYAGASVRSFQSIATAVEGVPTSADDTATQSKTETT